MNQVKAWVWKRRDSGMMLPVAERIGNTPPPFELLVVEVTDQGRRRPTRVARLVRPGSRVAVAELISPRLAWFRNDKFVLSGVECLSRQHATVNAAQSWLCQLALPSKNALFKTWTNHQEGVEISRHRVLSTGPTVTGTEISVSSVLQEDLGRHTTQALQKRDNKTHLALLDCEMEWMSEERFCLAGLQQYPASEQWPARLLKQGWLCEPDIVVAPLPPSERILRKMSLR